jgi:hypothetical protein
LKPIWPPKIPPNGARLTLSAPNTGNASPGTTVVSVVRLRPMLAPPFTPR